MLICVASHKFIDISFVFKGKICLTEMPHREEFPELNGGLAPLCPLALVEDHLADVTDLSPHLSLACRSSDGRGRVSIRTAIVWVILAAQQSLQLLPVEGVREGIERLLLQVLGRHFGPEGGLRSHGV